MNIHPVFAGNQRRVQVNNLLSTITANVIIGKGVFLRYGHVLTILWHGRCVSAFIGLLLPSISLFALVWQGEGCTIRLSEGDMTADNVVNTELLA
jgi:hypothetical protein